MIAQACSLSPTASPSTVFAQFRLSNSCSAVHSIVITPNGKTVVVLSSVALSPAAAGGATKRFELCFLTWPELGLAQRFVVSEVPAEDSSGKALVVASHVASSTNANVVVALPGIKYPILCSKKGVIGDLRYTGAPFRSIVVRHPRGVELVSENTTKIRSRRGMHIVDIDTAWKR